MKNNKAVCLVIIIVSFLAISYGTAYSYSFKAPLYKLANARRVDLKCLSAIFRLQIPVPERWKVEKAVLNFNYVNSSTILQGKSKLVLKLHDKAIAQVNLNPLAPEGTVRLSLPVDKLEHGYNELAFATQMHYQNDCEYPCAPDLWATLKLDEAELEMTYSLREVPLKLSSIANFLFDPKISPQGEVNIVVPELSAETTAWASAIASGVAKRFNYRSVVFSISTDIKQGYDNILIGNKEFVGKFLKPAGFDAEEIKGPFLKIMHLPRSIAESGRQADPFHALIVVAATKAGDLRLAAETFASMSISFPDSAEMAAMGIAMPDIPRYGGKSVIKADTKYTFKDLNLPTVTLRGVNADAAEISFRLPADFLVKQNLYSEIALHYAYGAALRGDSVINILLNGKLLRAINLNDVKGGLVEGYKLEIPTYLFKAGDNVLRFEPVLTPLMGKNCEYFQTENLFLTILERSTFKFPPMPHYVSMPKLELFMLNGFPITRWPDGHGAKIYLTDLKQETIEAALNIVGVITQKNGYPLFDIEFTSKSPEKYTGELMIVGDVHTIPEAFKKLTPMELTKQTHVPYPVVQSWASESQFAFSNQVSGLSPGRGVVTAFESPYKSGASVLVFTAYSSKEVRALSTALLEPAVQSDIKGDLVFINLENPDKNIVALDVGKKYFAGETGFISKIRAYFYVYSWLYYAAVALVIIALSLILFFFLNRYRKWRIKGE